MFRKGLEAVKRSIFKAIDNFGNDVVASNDQMHKVNII
jgi:hypothetical protein